MSSVQCTPKCKTIGTLKMIELHTSEDNQIRLQNY